MNLVRTNCSRNLKKKASNRGDKTDSEINFIFEIWPQCHLRRGSSTRITIKDDETDTPNKINAVCFKTWFKEISFFGLGAEILPDCLPL